MDDRPAPQLPPSDRSPRPRIDKISQANGKSSYRDDVDARRPKRARSFDNDRYAQDEGDSRRFKSTTEMNRQRTSGKTQMDPQMNTERRRPGETERRPQDVDVERQPPREAEYRQTYAPRRPPAGESRNLTASEDRRTPIGNGESDKREPPSAKPANPADRAREERLRALEQTQGNARSGYGRT